MLLVNDQQIAFKEIPVFFPADSQHLAVIKYNTGVPVTIDMTEIDKE